MEAIGKDWNPVFGLKIEERNKSDSRYGKQVA
jgi:hypothetical protein